jgi:hypothetical protein
MKTYLALALALLSAAGCAGQNRNEREADKITRAVINNDMAPVMSDLDPAIKGQVTRVRVAELSDELNQQGAYQGLKQTNATWCESTVYACFDVTFAKRAYREKMKVGSDGKVQYWWIHAAPAQNNT